VAFSGFRKTFATVSHCQICRPIDEFCVGFIF